MFIPLSLGNLRIAICGARKAAEQKFEEDKVKFSEVAFQQLHDGAVHNGLKPSESDLQNMRDMVARDVEHGMESHESTGLLEHFASMLEMADYYETHDEDADCVMISSDEFRVLKDHLNGGAKKD